MNYPDMQTYDILYARFLSPDKTQNMLEKAGDLTGKVFLDICCGAGRLTEAAMLAQTSRNIIIDSEAAMIAKKLKSSYVQKYIMSVEDALDEMHRKKIDIVDIAMCQQGINYWLTRETVKKLWDVMTPGGQFIFNTFNKQPSKTPDVRQYKKTDPETGIEREYVEVTWMVDDRWADVQHIQICEGLPPHYTEFKWMSPKYISDALNGYFMVKWCQKRDKTSLYQCFRSNKL